MLRVEVFKAALKLMLGRGSRRSYGQFGEDAVVQTLLKKSSGFYVDVGCYHPILYFNTYGLYRRGWQGIVIDPNRNLGPLFRIFRHRDVFVNTAVGRSDTRTYYEYADGAYNTLEKSEAVERRGPVHTRDVSVRPLAELVKEYDIQQIDFLNVDVEGMDLEVLTSHDWNIPPKVIAVEQHIAFESIQQSDVYAFLKEKNYRVHGIAGPTLVFCREN